ncbi:MAG: suppressor of fused domain protein [Bacteroidota bacterium]
MSKLIEKLKERFGEKNVKEINKEMFSFLQIDVQKRSAIKILMTKGLSDYKMPVSEKFIGKEFNELFFCLPSYWDLDDLSNKNMSWIYEILNRLHKHCIDKNTWFGHGHTIPFANPIENISETMKQKYFFLSEPVFLKEELTPIEINGKKIHFLAIIPIFEDEFDYKIGKGTYKFQKKLNFHDVSELLDDFRSTVLRSKWTLRRK